jgi:hypothetical protein
LADWVEAPGDPIYNPFPPVIVEGVPVPQALVDDYFPCVIFDPGNFGGFGSAHPYKMWHQAAPGPLGFG